MPRKVRSLIADLKSAGFTQVVGGKGAHRKFQHPRLSKTIILSGNDGNDAHHYQEKDVRDAIRMVSR